MINEKFKMLLLTNTLPIVQYTVEPLNSENFGTRFFSSQIKVSFGVCKKNFASKSVKMLYLI